MNLIDKKVTHKSFGTGSVVNHSDTVIEIHFATERKKFVFPDVFGKHLKLHDQVVANSLKKIIQKKENERKEEELKKEEERELLRKKQELRMEHEKLIKNHKLHPQSQMVFWCDPEEQKCSFEEWSVFSGELKSGKNKGKPNKPSRLYQNSAVLLTERDAGLPEEERRILGVFMVEEGFIGKLCEDGNIPAHSEYRIQLTEDESKKMLFWNYYSDEKFPHKMTWNTGKYRYFDNSLIAQVLQDIISLKKDPKDREQAQQFFDHFCKMNKIIDTELPKPNGALLRE